MVVTVSLVKPIFIPRYLSFCLPALLLLVGVGICRVRPAIFSWGLIVAISLCCVLGDIRYYQSDFDMQRQDWRGVTSYVFNHAQPGDTIFFCSPSGVVPFDYYSGQQKSAALRPKTLSEDWPKTGNGQNPSDLKPQDLVFVRGTNLRATPPVGRRVWLVLMFLNGGKEEIDVADAVGKWLSDGRQQVDAQDFPPLKVLLFDRAASGLPPDGKSKLKFERSLSATSIE
jgi:hypothetical protein